MVLKYDQWEHAVQGYLACISFVDHARLLSAIFESHGFEVASVACKHGGVPKESLGLRDDQKINPGSHESMCNPISQAELLDRADCEFNVVLGLCIGHDSMFFKHICMDTFFQHTLYR